MNDIDMATWVAPGTKTKVLSTLESAIRKVANSLPWFNKKGRVELIADNFGVTVKFILSGHFRLVHVSLEEMTGRVDLNFGYEDRFNMQLTHLYHITTNSTAYSSNDQITEKFEL